MKQFSITSGLATKSQDALGGTMGKTQSASIELKSDIDKCECSTEKATSTATKYTRESDTAGKSIQLFAEKFKEISYTIYFYYY